MKTNRTMVLLCGLLLFATQAARAQFTYTNMYGAIITLPQYNGSNGMVIPNGIEGGAGSFAYCTNVTTVTIPTGVTTIGIGAFWGCISLTGITIPASVTKFASDIGTYTFFGCTNLIRVFFQGNAPMADFSAFRGDHATIYYLPGTTGWSANFYGAPTKLWTLPYPLILNNSLSFGGKTNGFGFIISWATNLPVVVEASTSLVNPTWSPISTNTLIGGLSYFSDPQWTDYPARFYRLRSP